MQRASQDYDLTLDGNKFRLARGEDVGYVRQFRHSQVEESELFNPFVRGTMQSRPDLRGFYQSDWSGGQTWFKPTLPNSGADTYFASSLLDAWSKPGNLVPLNEFTATTDTNMPAQGRGAFGEDGAYYIVSDATGPDSELAVEYWSPAADAWVEETTFSSAIDIGTAVGVKLLYDPTDNFHVSLGQRTLNQVGTHYLGKFDVEGTADTTIYSNRTHAMGSTPLYFDGKVMVYDGDNIQALNAGKTAYDATAVTDDNLGYDYSLSAAGAYPLLGADGGSNVARVGDLNLAVVSDRGIFYVKHVQGTQGVEARIFQVEVTDSGTYLRTPIGRLPSGMVCLNVAWHLDSLLLIVTPDTFLAKKNLDTTGYFETQLWHVTQGSIGAIGTFDGSANPAESPHTFPYSKGPLQYIASDQKLWVYDAVRGGIHQAVTYSSNHVAGISHGHEDENSSGEGILLFVNANSYYIQKLSYLSDPKTGAWAAGSYTLESNYFEFGVPLETKQLRSVTALFEAGSANETYFIDVEADDSGSWTTVATMLCSTGNSPVTTDITALNVTGNRFRYRIRLQVDSGTNMPEFRGVGFKAISGETVEVWQFVIDATEIVNLENEIQRPDAVFDSLVTSARKNVEIQMTDHFGKLLADAETTLGVRLDSAVVEKNDRAEAKWTLQVTRTAV